MMIAKFGLEVIKHLMKHGPTNKLLRSGDHLKKCVPKYLRVAIADPG